MIPRSRHDIIIVGGGLSGGLLAWRLLQLRPSMKVLLIEASDKLGGNHTWSCFESDLTVDQAAWTQPLISHRWSGYDVRFPSMQRTLEGGYQSISSRQFRQTLMRALGGRVRLGARVQAMTDEQVVVVGGETFTAPCVIDARGQKASRHLMLGFQKFLGLEVRLDQPHGQLRPVIMDATVPQNDGYRFVYTLPLSPDTMLIEDTYYSDGTALSPALLHDRIQNYAHSRGWRIAEIIRDESGVLPIVLAGDIDRFLADQQAGAVIVGLGAALFHPTTGYSLPDALRVADRLAMTPILTTTIARSIVHALVRDHWSRGAIFRLLNRMLFKAGLPDQRYKIFERFYGLQSGLIRSFYAGRLSPLHKARLLIGRPPVAIRDALRCVSESQMLERHSNAATEA